MTKLTAFSRTAALTAALTLAPALAHAHPGHPGHDGLSFAAGFAHPFSGLDHLLVMVAVGLWAVQLGGRAMWLVPGAFLSAMTVGSVLGMSGMSLPFIEQGIAASIFIFGALIAMAARFSVGQSAALVALFALFHGFAHGAEAPASSSGFSYVAGFAIATAALHAFGVFGGLGLRTVAAASWIRAAGAAVIVSGLLLALN